MIDHGKKFAPRYSVARALGAVRLVGGLTAKQDGYLRLIVAEVQRENLARTYGYCAVATAIVESGLQMYANGYCLRSLVLPHDNVGYDHASMNFMQQQTGPAYVIPSSMSTMTGDGWGTPDQLMNPTYATQAFLARLKGVYNVGYTDQSLGAACQAVQGSAYPTRYQQVMGTARAYVDAVWGPQVIPPAVDNRVHNGTVTFPTGSFHLGEGHPATFASPDGRVHVTFDYLGRLLVTGHGGELLWQAPKTAAGGFAVFKGNRISVCKSTGKEVWAKGFAPGATRFVIQDDGNLVAYDGHNRAHWATGSNKYKGTK